MKFLNRRGFSLTELLAGTVMLAILGTITAVVVSNVQSMVGSTDKVLKIEEMHSEIMLILSDPLQCSNTFYRYGIPAAAGTVVIPNGSGIRIRDDSVKYPTNSLIGNRNLRIESMTARDFNSTATSGARAPYTGVFTLEIVYSYELTPGGTVRRQTRHVRLQTLPLNWTTGTPIVDTTRQAGCSAGLGAGLGLDLGPFVTRENLNNTKFNRFTINGRLDVLVNVVVQDAGRINFISDERLKKDFKKLNFSYEQINKVNGYFFNWKKDGVPDYGFMADEIEQLDPSLVKHEPGRTAVVKYQEIVPILHSSVMSLGSETKDIKKRITKLNKKIQ